MKRTHNRPQSQMYYLWCVPILTVLTSGCSYLTPHRLQTSLQQPIMEMSLAAHYCSQTSTSVSQDSTVCSERNSVLQKNELQKDDLPESVQLQDTHLQETHLQEKWWQIFENETVDELIDSALRDGYLMSASDARWQQVQKQLRQTKSRYIPSIDFSLNAARNESNINGTSVDQDIYNGGLSTSYELDVWGRLASQVSAGKEHLLISDASRRALRNTIASEILLAWFGIAKESANLELLQTQLERTQSALQLIENRFRLGQVRISDVWQQQQLIEAVNADRIRSETRKLEFQNRLLRWTGGVSGNIDTSSSKDWQQLVSIDFPSISNVTASQLTRRPDIAEAWSKVRLADNQVATALADRFPRLSISASYQSSSDSFSSLFDDWLSNLAANLILPVIDGGRRRAEVESRRFALEEAIAGYRQAWLVGAIEVQTSINNRQQFEQLLVNTNRRLALADKSASYLTQRYRRGVGDFLSVLRAQQDVLTLETRSLENKWSLLQALIQQYKAVGSGHWSDSSESTESVGRKTVSNE